MANPKSKPPKAPEPPQPQPPPQSEGPLYPAIESFIETASRDQVAELFGSIREGLSGLKGPKADQAKKVHKAIDTAQALLEHLLEVREKLEAERNKPPPSRR